MKLITWFYIHLKCRKNVAIKKAVGLKILILNNEYYFQNV